ncbi:RraA family protein [Pseudonocardia cypriaca]|uniref:Putative 4-hydroxy-4-methyl-2-oxoglutarate aldolase n=1 Tax=Pseudonocardia cypriaca TaxID=882449 RepID=A0A543FR01_9PSEU|nr:dimethylmenaquinone methyltransferase [Pseudonocardia cypriaca]TQM36257.1 regulator of RNase E activity RraA [Pseudonocardia cypriaca]
MSDTATVAKRLKALYTAVVYDIMDEMALPHQCLDLGIAPLDRDMQVAGPAYTVMAGPDIRERDEMPENTKLADFGVFTQMYEGCVVVVGAAGERQSGIWGELMSNASRARGATGVVIDGGIRDGRLVREIDGLGVFARYTSPIESLRRSRIHDIEIPISMTGTTSSQVRVNPGDWIFGDEDGVLVIPKDALDEVLAKSEEAKDIEDKVREEVQAGTPVIDVYNKYGRL